MKNKLEVSDYTCAIENVGVDAARVEEVAVDDHKECFSLSSALPNNLVDVG
jgi:hypothetical protein